MQVVSAGARAPDLSILFPAWNVEPFVTEAVGSLLDQRGVVAEIVLSDDCSADRTYEAMLAAVAGYHGPHRVLVSRNPRNLGIDHMVHLVDVASCDVMMAAHGDDVSEPQRGARLLDEMNRSGAFVASSNMTNVDERGLSLGLQNPVGDSCLIAAAEIARRGWMHTMFGSTLAWRRQVYTAFPRLDSSQLPIGHDHVVPFRGAVLGGFRYVAEPLVRYRRHAGQWKNRLHADRSAEIQREAAMANAMSSRLRMLRDVRHRLAAAPPDPAELRALEEILLASLAELASDWVATRDDLYRDGWRADWVPRQQFETSRLARIANPGRLGRARRRLVRRLWRAYGIASDLLHGRLSRRSTH